MELDLAADVKNKMGSMRRVKGCARGPRNVIVVARAEDSVFASTPWGRRSGVYDRFGKFAPRT